MPDRSTPLRVIAALLTTACAGNPAPEGFLPSRVEAQSSPYGGWMELELANKQRVAGELLAVTPDSVWVLTAQGGRVIATRAVMNGKLTAYQSQAGAISGWTALGVLSTASNGVVLVITAPLWILTGTVAASNDSHDPVMHVPRPYWTQLAPFARFPQGMPAGALQSLKPLNIAPAP